jgi:AAA family ATP:ADP antiporter
MFVRVARTLWGDLTIQEIKRFSILALSLFCILGPYWLLRTLKDSFFDKWVDLSYQPKAKIVSVIVVTCLVLIYSKLTDYLEKHHLLYVVCSFYAFLYLIMAAFCIWPMPEMHNAVASHIPGRFIGWFAYLTIESFGTLAVAIFWSFIASTTTTESAKRGYAMVLAGATLGALSGSAFSWYAPAFDRIFGKDMSFPFLLIVASTVILLVPFIIKWFMTVIHDEVTAQIAQEAKTPKTGFLEGFRLLVTNPYLLGVFVVATVYEIVGTIMDLQMKMLAKQAYGPGAEFTSFNGLFGMVGNVLPLVITLFGTNYLIRNFGIRFCLVAFPIATACVVVYVKLNASLWPAFVAMVVIKGLTYALNNPVKEMLYIPASKDVKFKAKGWIDGFGARLAKAGGSGVNDFFSANLAALMSYGAFISLGVIGFWVIVAFLLGSGYNKLIEEKRIIK